MLEKGDAQRIRDSVATKEIKIILLWLITQIDYRGHIGDEAVGALADIIPDEEVRSAFFQIVGFASAKPDQDVLINTFAELSEGVLY